MLTLASKPALINQDQPDIDWSRINPNRLRERVVSSQQKIKGLTGPRIQVRSILLSRILFRIDCGIESSMNQQEAKQSLLRTVYGDDLHLMVSSDTPYPGAFANEWKLIKFWVERDFRCSLIPPRTAG